MLHAEEELTVSGSITRKVLKAKRIFFANDAQVDGDIEAKRCCKRLDREL